MADTHETIADIIAEKRRQADEIERDCAEKMNRGEMVSDRYVREFVADIRREADRLEAAHRRERGNAAKLREALEKIHTIAKTFIDATKMRRVTDSARLDVSNIKDLADAALAALSAPPRNCDRFANAVEAMAELKHVHSYCAKENRRCLEDCPDCGKEWCSLAWLFALATESEAQA